MGFITDLELEKNKKLAAQQVKDWSDSAINALNQVQNYKQSLVAQLELMKVNTVDYTEVDCNEAQALIDTINSKLTSI
jgi:hypothetical protein